jgi:ketosteroid isomerase-like protein
MGSSRKIAAFLAVLFVAGVSARGQANHKVEDSLRAADQAWLKVYAAKDLDKTVAFFDEQGSILADNQPAATGKKAITEVFREEFKLQDYKLTWAITWAGVAASGDLGYTSGTYDFSCKDASGKLITDKGKYLTVWKKQKDGSWKVLLDMSNSDLPAPGA